MQPTVFQVRKPLVLSGPGVPLPTAPHPVAVVVGNQDYVNGQSRFNFAGIPALLPTRYSAPLLPQVTVGDQTNIDAMVSVPARCAPFVPPPPIIPTKPVVGDQTNFNGVASFVYYGAPNTFVTQPATPIIVTVGDQTFTDAVAIRVDRATGHLPPVRGTALSFVLGDQTYFDVPPQWLTPITSTEVPLTGVSDGDSEFYRRAPQTAPQSRDFYWRRPPNDDAY